MYAATRLAGANRKKHGHESALGLPASSANRAFNCARAVWHVTHTGKKRDYAEFQVAAPA